MREERLPLDYILTHQDIDLPASLEEVRILMVVDGNCQVIKDSGKLTLHKSDYLLINVMEEVSLVLKPGSYVAVLLNCLERQIGFPYVLICAVLMENRVSIAKCFSCSRDY